MKMYLVGATKDIPKKKKVYKCPDCKQKYFNPNSLYKHVEREHRDNIPEGHSVSRYVFNRNNNKTTSYCVICRKNEVKWNEKTKKYCRLCEDPKCKEEFIRRYRKNCKEKLGTENPASTSEHQRKAIAGRKTSGEYKFQDKGIVGYSSSYEEDFLRFLDEEYEWPSEDVIQCEVTFETNFNGRKTIHIPDYHILSLNLIIQIKDGGDNPNMNSHIQNEGRERQRLGDEAIVKDGSYNYIKIVNKQYADFIELVNVLKSQSIDDESIHPVIVVIPE